jgi:ATP-binding cassette subfamily C protein CydCD
MRIDRRLLKLARSDGFHLAFAVLLGFTAGLLIVAQAGIISRVVSSVFLSGASLSGVSRPLLFLLCVIILRAAATWGAETSAGIAAVRIKTRLRRQVITHLVNLGPAYRSEQDTGELVNTCTEGVEALEAYFSQYLPQVVLAALLPLAFLVVVFPIDPLSAAILLLTAPLIPVFMVLIGSQADALTKRQWQTLSRLSAYFLDVIQGLSTLKALGRSRLQVSVLASASERYRVATMSVLRVTFLSALVLEMVATLSTAIVAVEIGLRLLYGRLSFEQAFFILLFAPEFYLPLRSLGARFHAGMAGVAGAGRIFNVLETPLPDATERPVAPDAGAPSRAELAEIIFEDVSYRYPDGRQALEGVSLRIPAGQKIALVGRSGAGKSTLVGLLLGFLQPSAGEVRLLDLDLGNLPALERRRHIAWIPQHPYLFNASMGDNLRLARPGATQAELEWAARQAQAHEFIAQLSKGYDTPVGERGIRLSGGQAQRIALARAFLKDAPVLVLDEATSFLDPEQEDLIQQAIDQLTRDRTVIIIAHRLSTVYTADQIALLDHGRLVASGTHQQLFDQSRLYRELVRSYAGAELPAELSLPDISTVQENDLPDASADSVPQAVIQGIRSRGASPLIRLLALVSGEWKSILLSVLMGFAAVASGIGLMACAAYIISAAALQPSIAILQVPIVAVRFFGISRGLFRYLERYTSHQTTFKILARLRVWFYAAIEPLAPAGLSRLRSGDLLSRVVGDIASLENFYVRALAPPLVALGVASTSFLFMSSYSPSLGISLLGFLLLAGIGVPLLARWWGSEAGRRQVAIRGALSASLADGIQGSADLLVYAGEGEYLRQIDARAGELASVQGKMAKVTALQSALVGMLAGAAMWGTLLLATPLVQRGQIDGVYLGVLALTALTCFEAVLPLPQAAQHLGANLAAARRLFEIADAEPAVKAPPAVIPLTSACELKVDELSFSYPENQEPKVAGRIQQADSPYVLDGLSFTLEAGKSVAIVGASGSGKTTLVNLLLRFWDYSAGSITIGGAEIRSVDSHALRERLAVVMQNPYIFSATLRENLLIARPDASPADLAAAVRQAQLSELVESLPQGLDTWVGEHGFRLSGGERQRLALARAFLRRSPILILDEPTANLDASAERMILQTIRSDFTGHSTLLITHRLVGLEHMDEILVVQKGRVINRGRHAELLAQQGVYWHMVQIQNQILTNTLSVD